MGRLAAAMRNVAAELAHEHDRMARDLARAEATLAEERDRRAPMPVPADVPALVLACRRAELGGADEGELRILIDALRATTVRAVTEVRGRQYR